MLAKKLKGIMCHVNLIPANPVKENSFKKPDRNKILRFKERLAANGVNATVRRTLGADIDASCGQLRRVKALQIFSKTDRGRVRTDNQDAYFAGKITDDSVFAVVCDGMGGANAGNVASELAVRHISEYVIRSYRDGMDMTDTEKTLKNA